MELLHAFLDLFRDLPGTITLWIREYGAWAYAIFFAIIFVETGVVIMPFLPGDSLLFAAGAIARTGGLDLGLLCAVIITAAVIGDSVNYHIGALFAAQVAKGERIPLIKQAHLERAVQFFRKHGGKAVLLSRFVPIVRTLTPFVAGAGAMPYGRFMFYNVSGGIAWTVICVGAGWLFGGIPAVQENFELVILAVIALSVLPLVIEWLMRRRQRA